MPEGVTVQNYMECTECKKPCPENELIRYQNKLICINCKEAYFQRIREGVEAPGAEMRYSSVRRRFVAMMLDGVILGVIQVILTLIVLGPSLGATPDNPNAALGGSILLMLFAFIFAVAYHVGFLGWKGATPGKMALNIKVVTPDGQPIGYGRALLRYIGVIVNGFTISIGYIIAIFDDEKRALHDRIASTRVIYN